MSTAELQSTVEAIIRRYGVPGMAIATADNSGRTDYLFVGADDDGRPIGRDSIFPVASITKLATALAVLRLADRGALAFDDPLAVHLRDAAAAVEGVTIRRLLAHNAGLPNDVAEDAAPYTPALTWSALARACLATPPAFPPNTRVLYSNVGYGLLAMLVERKTGRAFRDALGDLVLGPLDIEAYLGIEPPRPPVTVDDVRSEHVGTEIEPYNSTFWRSLGLPWGGLLSTVDGALALTCAFLGIPSGFLSPATLAEATRNQTNGLAGGLGGALDWPACPWGLGPEIRNAKSPHWAPSEASPDSFGHAGASGCLAWSDPAAGITWAVLGARTFANGWLVRGGPAIGAAILRGVKR